MSLPKITRLATAGSAAAWVLWSALTASAWQPPEGVQPPTLPETEVEAAPAPVDGAPPASGANQPFDPSLPLGAPGSDPNAPPDDGAQDFNASDLPPSESAFSSPEAQGYNAESSTTGSVIDVPNIALPASVDTITQALIQDQQILTFEDAVRNSAGAVQVGDGLFADRIFIRGLEVRTRDFRKNGFLDPTFTPRDFANIERVEILKGPASVLYGSAAPSGVVNFITKKPVNDVFACANYQFGNFGLNRTEIDVNDRVTCDGSVLFRFNGSYEDSDSFRDFDYTERYLIAPSVRVQLDSNTTLTWEGEHLENNRIGDRGLPAIGGNALFLPPERYIGEPANDFLYTEDYRTSLVLRHRFCNDWTLSLGAYTVFYEFPGSQTQAASFLPAPPFSPTDVVRVRQDFTDQEHASSFIGNLTGDYCLGDMRHRLLFGTEQVYYDSDVRFTARQLDVVDIPGVGPVPFPFDTANPVYNNPTQTNVVFDANFPVFRQYRQGYYMQDFIELSPHVQLLGGVRFDEIDLRFVRNFGFGDIITDQDFVRTTPRAGVVVQPLPEVLSLYFNYSRSFNPPGGGGFGFTGVALQPELGESYESGVKMQLLDGLAVHAAGFHITRENVPFATFDNVGRPVLLQVGEERSQGAEFELQGTLTERWSMLANYAYTDTRLTDPVNPEIFGQRQRNVPLNSSSVWSRYNFIDNCCTTFGAALGMVFLDDRNANLSGNVELPDYTRWDGGLYVTHNHWRGQVYLENLFDRHYASSSINELQVYPGAPFTARALVGASF